MGGKISSRPFILTPLNLSGKIPFRPFGPYRFLTYSPRYPLVLRSSVDNINSPQPARHNLQLCYARPIAVDVVDAFGIDNTRYSRPAGHDLSRATCDHSLLMLSKLRFHRSSLIVHRSTFIVSL